MIIIEYLISCAGLILYHPIISGLSLLLIITLLYLFFKKKAAKIILNLSGIVNLLFLPFSFFIGGMATDAPTSTFLDFCIGFFYIQGFPLLWFAISLFIYKRLNKVKLSI